MWLDIECFMYYYYLIRVGLLIDIDQSSCFSYSMTTSPLNVEITIPQEDGEVREGTGMGGYLVVIRLITRESANVMGHPNHSRNRGQNDENKAMVALVKFKKLSTYIFNGMSGPEASESWLDQIEGAFHVMQLAPNLKLSSGTYQLADQLKCSGRTFQNVGMLQHGSNHQSLSKKGTFHRFIVV